MKEIYKFFTDEERIERQTVTANMADIAIRKSRPNYLAITEQDEYTPAEDNNSSPPIDKRKARATKAEVPGRPGFYYTGGGLDPIDIAVNFDYDDETRKIRTERRLAAVAKMRKRLLRKLEQQ